MLGGEEIREGAMLLAVGHPSIMSMGNTED